MPAEVAAPGRGQCEAAAAGEGRAAPPALRARGAVALGERWRDGAMARWRDGAMGAMARRREMMRGAVARDEPP